MKITLIIDLFSSKFLSSVWREKTFRIHQFSCLPVIVDISILQQQHSKGWLCAEIYDQVGQADKIIISVMRSSTK